MPVCVLWISNVCCTIFEADFLLHHTVWIPTNDLYETSIGIISKQGIYPLVIYIRECLLCGSRCYTAANLMLHAWIEKIIRSHWFADLYESG
jgi:hypothetical protein